MYLVVDTKNGGQDGKKGISVTEMFGSGLKIINLEFSSRITTPALRLFIFIPFFLPLSVTRQKRHTLFLHSFRGMQKFFCAGEKKKIGFISVGGSIGGMLTVIHFGTVEGERGI